MSTIVLDLNDRRPVWALPDFVAAEVAAAAPAGWTVASLSTWAEGTGDGSGAGSPEVLAAVRDAVGYVGFGVSAQVLRAAPALRWVHSASAGVASALTPEMLGRDIVLTNSAGVHGPPMAEAVLGMLLYFGRGFDLAVQGAARHTWSADRFYAGEVRCFELADAVVGIVGYGGIGREVARRVRALGARVLGLRRRGAGGVEDGVEVLVGDAGLQRLLRDSDAVVITAPDTPATRAMIGAAELAAMKPSAVLVNVSRGPVVDEAALVAALQSGRLRGAGLDVFAQEPLEPQHPLWTLPNVLVTPHVSPLSDRFWRRQTDLVVDNLGRFGRGEPLRNVVDKRAGY